MRIFLTLLVVSGISFGQATERPKLSSAQAATTAQSDKDPGVTTVPAGPSKAAAPDPN